MSEVEKLYKNAGVELYYCTYPRFCEVFMNNKCNYDCDFSKSRFTPEKQLELIKWLIQKNFNDERIIRSNFEKTYFYCSYIDDYCESAYFEKLEEALANVFNYFWQDLTEEERKQIAEILKG